MGATSKFMQSFSPEILSLLKNEAQSRGISIQELLRAVIVPDWFRYLKDRKVEVKKAPWES